MRHKKAQRREVFPDKIHNSLHVTKFINRLMMDGKKTTAERVVYGAFQRLEAAGKNPLETFEKALANVSPKVEVKARRVGGANYQVPIEVRQERRMSLSIRWLLEAATKRSNKEYHTFEEKLAAELAAAAAGEGEAMKKKEVMHKQAEANKAFSHFRW
jgi:small subunit ribosomal protein S7